MINLKVTCIEEYTAYLERNNYNEITIRTYKQYFKRFLRHFPKSEPQHISYKQIRKYLLFLVEKKNYSPSSQNNAINAIKLYYKDVLQREVNDYYFPRPRREKKLPKILTEKEIANIFRNIKDLRNKCMIYLIYSAGLTPSEVTYIKIDDVNSDKMQIFISSARGNKDRFVILSKKLLNLLRKYFVQYKPHKWLFESKPGKQYSKRKIQKSFKNAVKKSGITKPATLTILKNSFAVQLIEKGVDIRFVQQMLGHKHSKTTMKYLKVSKRDLSIIKSPLDNLEI